MVIGGIVEENKQQLKVWLPGSVIRMLKHEIALNRGTISKGILSSEVENAINERIVTLRKRRSSMQQAAREQQNTRELDNLIELRDKVIEYMTVQTKLWPEGPKDRIVEKHLIEAIASIKVVKDRRSQRHWIDRLFRTGLIERTGPREYVFCELKENEQPMMSITSIRSRNGVAGG